MRQKDTYKINNNKKANKNIKSALCSSTIPGHFWGCSGVLPPPRKYELQIAFWLWLGLCFYFLCSMLEFCLV